MASLGEQIEELELTILGRRDQIDVAFKKKLPADTLARMSRRLDVLRFTLATLRHLAAETRARQDKTRSEDPV